MEIKRFSEKRMKIHVFETKLILIALHKKLSQTIVFENKCLTFTFQ